MAGRHENSGMDDEEDFADGSAPSASSDNQLSISTLLVEEDDNDDDDDDEPTSDMPRNLLQEILRQRMDTNNKYDQNGDESSSINKKEGNITCSDDHKHLQERPDDETTTRRSSTSSGVAITIHHPDESPHSSHPPGNFKMRPQHDNNNNNNNGDESSERGATPTTTRRSIPGALAVPGIDASRLAAAAAVAEGEESTSSAPNISSCDRSHHDCDAAIHVNHNDLEVDPEQDTTSGRSLAAAASLTEATMITAEKVDSDFFERLKESLRQTLRREIIKEAAEAQVVSVPMTSSAFLNSENVNDEKEQRNKNANNNVSSSSNSKERRRQRTWSISIGLFGVIACVVIAVVMSVTLNNDSDDKNDNKEVSVTEGGTSMIGMSTSEIVKDRGHVRCGVLTDFPGMSMSDHLTGKPFGMAVDQCKAISLLVFGTPAKIKMIPVTTTNRFKMLANGTVDTLTGATAMNMERDVAEATTQIGFVFSTSCYNTGFSFGGVPEFVECAENLDASTGICTDLKVCALAGTSDLTGASNLIPKATIVPVDDTQDAIYSFIAGDCNVMVAPPGPSRLGPLALESVGHKEPYAIGEKVYDSRPHGIVTRQNDPQWSNMANLFVDTMYLAESNNFTEFISDDMQNLVDSNARNSFELSTMIQTLIQEFGNYATIYESLEPWDPRKEMNEIYDWDSSDPDYGVMKSAFFGNLTVPVPNPSLYSTLGELIATKRLRCAVEVGRTGFAEKNSLGDWEGLHVEMCRALSAALFEGNTDQVMIVELQSYQEGFFALTNGTADVMAGARVTMQAKYVEPTTQQGYQFSMPYYYDRDSKYPFAFMTLPNDNQWSSFVYWIVNALIYAEENGLGTENGILLPTTTLFGDSLQTIFQDCISAMGSYGDIYARTLEPILSRSGANLLNQDSGPLIYPIPFQ